MWFRISSIKPNRPLISLVLIAQMVTVFSMSIDSTQPGGLHVVDFSEADDPIGIDLGDASIDSLGKTADELQKNWEMNKARAKDENMLQLLHELDRRTRLLSKWRVLRSLRFG